MSENHKKILLLGGDGIGPEVVEQAKRIIEFLIEKKLLNCSISEDIIGGIAYDKTGSPLPDKTLKAAKNSDAILLGAVGGDKWKNVDFDKRPEQALLDLRKELDVFANLRPAICFSPLADSSSLKKELIEGLDIMIIRELSSGIYFGNPRGYKKQNNENLAFNTLVYKQHEIERIAEIAMKLAMQRGGKLCSVDKANVLESSLLWRKTIEETAKKFPKLQLSHMYVDNAAMQLVKNPKQFDVIVTMNMFGDILSDEAAALVGSLGLLPSASLGIEGSPSLYEPVHGSAPDIAGKNMANPIAIILSVAMMLRYSFKMKDLGMMIEKAINSILTQGFRTADIMQTGGEKLSTSQMGDKILQELDYLLSNKK